MFYRFCFLIFLLAWLNAQESIPKPRNPLENYRAISNALNIPFPTTTDKIPLSIKYPHYQDKEEITILKSQEDFDPFVLSHSVFNITLDKISPIFSEKINDFSKRYIPKAIFKIKLNSHFTEESQNIGGDINLTFPILEHKNSPIFFQGGFMRDPQTLQWSERYGIEHQLKHKSLQNFIFTHSIMQKNGIIDENTWIYGIQYSPSKRFSTYIKRENNKVQNDNTKAGILYRIDF